MTSLLRRSLPAKKVTAAAANARRCGISSTVPPRAIYESVCDLVGRTPVVKIQKLAPPGVDLFAKLEYFNPMASVKDRLALAIIEDGEKKGLLKPGQTVVEATSGNTGIALAMVCAAKGYPFVSVMAETFSIERRKIMRGLGAKVVITPKEFKGLGMVQKAQELAEKHGWFQTLQFENEANYKYHSNTTGPEILSDFANMRLDYWVTGFGTGGTFTGAGKMIKEARPDTKIILSEPANAAMVSSGTPQPEEKGVSHPAWEPHPIQGWSPDFIPGNTKVGMDLKLYDEIVPVSGDEAIATSKKLAALEGIFTGISGGATAAAALKVCEMAEPGSAVLCMIPDTGERYLSTPLFADVGADMDDEETELSLSTPNFQLSPPTTE
eukprot:CAMPEP_0114506386 /NCGR_PEP_ID=MMETSP0109-20121206/11399_1 /TAXON_ID=29199 /ORGANISM="Chlorarachnion reptans, Strain CCCM449" /LENGTH=380 /DNA_ID=CAMNT_0001684969 /DNA_START=10 /DNA_END=1152 /DNA_ORIENTATION=+